MAITDFFDRGLGLGPHKVAYKMGDQVWTFQEAYDLSCRIANALVAAGCAKETKCAALSANDAQAWLCILGLWRAGLVWAPLNPMSSLDDQVHLVSGFDVEVLFYQKAFEASVQTLKARCPKLRLLVCLDRASTGAETLDSWCGGFPASPPDRPVDQEDLAAIMPTGGTTGLPKGAMVTHRNLGLFITNSIVNCHYPPGDPIVNLAAAPMTHTAGVLTLPASARGGKVVIVTKPDPVTVLQMIAQERITEFFLPPTVIYRLLDMPGIEAGDYSSLRYFSYGAAPMSVGKLREALRVFGPVMLQGYGQTEAPGSIAFLLPGDHYRDGEIADDRRLSSCGIPSVFNATAILDSEGRPVPAGESGEICVRGDIVMRGYYKQPDKTAETIIDGWLHTGDLGHLDPEGYLHITDRKRDMIITGGFNVYPSEVEQVIWSHPAVMDCAVVGAPDDHWGEAVTAVVERKAGADVSEAELIALCKAKLGSVKAPKSVDFLDALPRSPVGKVLKREIRDRYWKGQTRRI